MNIVEQILFKVIVKPPLICNPAFFNYNYIRSIVNSSYSYDFGEAQTIDISNIKENIDCEKYVMKLVERSS